MANLEGILFETYYKVNYDGSQSFEQLSQHVRERKRVTLLLLNVEMLLSKLTT